MQNRFKSKVVWSTIFALVLFILKNYGLLEVLQLSSDDYNYIVDSILGIMVILGVLNNPTDSEGF